MSNNAPIISNPVMLDRVIGEIQQGLSDNLSWLDVAFGRAQRLTKKMNGNTIITPNVYCGGWNGHGENDYIEVSPDSKIGNFSFFEIDDPETIDGGPWARDIQCPFSLIFWFDLTRVYGMADNRNIEYIKAEILRVLNGRTGWTLSQGRVTVNQIYERVENIYRGYSLSEIDNQFLMHPYAGLRFSGILQFMELCFDEPPTPGPVVPVVPPEALQFDATRFALDSVGNGELFRIRGNSQVLDGVLKNLMLEKFDIYGYNQIDPTQIIWQPTDWGYYVLATKQFRVVPGKQYVVYYADAVVGQTSNWEIYTTKDGVHVESQNIVRGEPIIIDDDVNLAYVTCHYLHGIYRSNLIVALYDEQQAGTPEFYRKTIALDVSQLIGYDENGQAVQLFPNGLLAAGNGVRDEIFSTVAVRRVGMRLYLPGDEFNPDYLTDGSATNYPLSEPEVFTIVKNFDFIAERGGTCFQTPETLPALLDIVIE